MRLIAVVMVREDAVIVVAEVVLAEAVVLDPALRLAEARTKIMITSRTAIREATLVMVEAPEARTVEVTTRMGQTRIVGGKE
jgi:carbonic anhydrase/acetyltransferase-like protein (isoleucine patch superfamily)